MATMLQGEKCLLTCAPEYAYGDRGAGDKIKPGATLEFEVSGVPVSAAARCPHIHPASELQRASSSP